MNAGSNAAILPHPRATEDVLQSLLDHVQKSGIQVGDRLPPIRELTQRLGVKPTAVRDALVRAQALGLVRVLPRAGAILRATLPAAGKSPPDEGPVGPLMSVLVPDDANLFHLHDARRLIEVELAGRAAERRRLEDLLPVRRALDAMLQVPEGAWAEHVNQDIRFHVEIARLAGNDVLFAIQRTLMESLRPHLIGVAPTRDRRDRADRSHATIYAALVAGDAERARAEMREHLSLAYDSLLRVVQEPPVVSRPAGSQP